MKKFNLLLALALVFGLLIGGCKKDERTVPSLNTQQENTTLKVPAYNESNSTAIAWNQLPDKLKNALELSCETHSADKINSTYKYFIGTWGGSGGGSYAMFPTSSTDRIYAIAFRSGGFVDALTVWYIRSNGSLYYYSRGGTGGAYYIQYLSSNEYVYAIGGRSGGYIDRLTIYTNYKSFSYGGNGGAAFYQYVPFGDQILGFFGGSGTYIDRIGCYVYSN
jgi:Jacalin-like lectin domain